MQSFLEKQEKNGYGYNGKLESIRSTHFSRLKGGGNARENSTADNVVYLDTIGGALFSEQVVQECTKALCLTLRGNPHAHSDCSLLSTAEMAAARRDVLAHFNTNERHYAVVFTHNATHACKLLGESFHFVDGQSRFVHSDVNHTSVLGMRRSVAARGATVECVTDVDKFIREEIEKRQLNNGTTNTGDDANAWSLLVYPGECNFSGVKLSLDLAHRVHEAAENHSARWCCFVDTAALAGCSPIDLSAHAIDFLCVSMYKICGWPQGVGALLVRRDRAHLVHPKHGQRQYYGGGTVSVIRAHTPVYEPREALEAALEDGTPPFAMFVGVRLALRFVHDVFGGMAAIRAHCETLRSELASRLLALRHAVEWQWVQLMLCTVHFSLLPLVVAYATAAPFRSNLAFYVYMGVFFLLGGLLTSHCYEVAAIRSPPKQKPVATIMMNVALYVGVGLALPLPYWVPLVVQYFKRL